MGEPNTVTGNSAGQEDEASESRLALLKLIQESGAKPISSIEDLRAEFWTEDETENFEDFDVWLRNLREEKDANQ
jgi:hypothetical protein